MDEDLTPLGWSLPPFAGDDVQSFKKSPSSGGSGGGSMSPPPPGSSGRVPPHSREAERSVIGAILLKNESLDAARDIGIRAEDFYFEVHQRIFECATSLSERRQPVDLVTLTAALKDRGWFEQIGGTTALTGIVDESFLLGNVEYYARIIRDKAILRRLLNACNDVARDTMENTEDVEAFLDTAEAKIFAVRGESEQKGFSELRSILMGNLSSIEQVMNKHTDITGLATGFTKFDQLTTGLHPGQVMIVAARPGMGKTSWFLSAIQHTSVANKAVAALFSLEMTKDEIGFRFLSGLSRIDSKKLKTGRLAERDWHRLMESAEKLSQSRILVDDSAAITVLDIRARCRRLLSREKRLDLIVVDYLQLMKGLRTSRGEQNREREIAEISRGLKELAKELKVPIIALSQLSRGVEQRQDKRPNLSDLRESGSIEQDADLVCFIYRDEYYNKDSEERGKAELIIAKNRSGETGTVTMAWLGQYTLFANLADDEPGTPV